jgi:hypothetical protein
MIGMRSRSWRRTELTKRSATAFARGARTGVVMILMLVPGAAAHTTAVTAPSSPTHARQKTLSEHIPNRGEPHWSFRTN